MGKHSWKRNQKYSDFELDRDNGTIMFFQTSTQTYSSFPMNKRRLNQTRKIGYHDIVNAVWNGGVDTVFSDLGIPFRRLVNPR